MSRQRIPGGPRRRPATAAGAGRLSGPCALEVLTFAPMSATSEAPAAFRHAAARPGPLRLLGEAIEDIRSRRRLVRYLVQADIKKKGADTFLGNLWWIMDPLLQMGVYVVFVSLILDVKTPDYPLFILAAILPWKWFTSSLGDSAQSVVSQEKLIKQIQFPKLVLPVAATTAGVVGFLFGLIPLGGIMLLYAERISPFLLLVPVIAFVQYVFTLGMALLVSAINVFFRDLGNVLRHVLRLWFDSGAVMTKSIVTATLLVAAAQVSIASAQGPRPQVVSPEVTCNRDHPAALCERGAAGRRRRRGLDGKPHPLTKGSDGVWTTTIGPLEPDIYTYAFNVDGVSALNPQNANTKYGYGSFGPVGSVQVPGETPQFYDVKPVPAWGDADLGRMCRGRSAWARTVWVYTPPDYDKGKGLSGAVSAARRRRRRDGLDDDRPRQPDPRQPDRREAGQADGGRDAARGTRFRATGPVRRRRWSIRLPR